MHSAKIVFQPFKSWSGKADTSFTSGRSVCQNVSFFLRGARAPPRPETGKRDWISVNGIRKKNLRNQPREISMSFGHSLESTRCLAYKRWHFGDLIWFRISEWIAWILHSIASSHFESGQWCFEHRDQSWWEMQNQRMSRTVSQLSAFLSFCISAVRHASEIILRNHIYQLGDLSLGTSSWMTHPTAHRLLGFGCLSYKKPFIREHLLANE